MILRIKKRHGFIFKSMVWGIATAVFLLQPLTVAGQSMVSGMPKEQILSLAPAYEPPLMIGITIDPENPLEFDFIFSQGDKDQMDESDAESLIKYFLAGLAIPEGDLWVNLSPFESDRIISESLAQTDVGRILLTQDYVLKQLSSSLTYPETEIGKQYWQALHTKVSEKYGTTDLPLNTFNKVWIVPKKAVIFEEGFSAFIESCELKVLLEDDYFALENSLDKDKFGMQYKQKKESNELNELISDVTRETLIPLLEKEVNESEHFAPLRQIYHSLILALWYKEVLKNNIVNTLYADQEKIQGIDLDDKEVKQKVYHEYVKAFERGVYDYVKEDYDPKTQQIIPRKYFSGGVLVTEAQRVNAEADRGGILQRMSRSAVVVARILLGVIGVNGLASAPVKASEDPVLLKEIYTNEFLNQGGEFIPGLNQFSPDQGVALYGVEDLFPNVIVSEETGLTALPREVVDGQAPTIEGVRSPMATWRYDGVTVYGEGMEGDLNLFGIDPSVWNSLNPETGELELDLSDDGGIVSAFDVNAYTQLQLSHIPEEELVVLKTNVGSINFGIGVVNRPERDLEEFIRNRNALFTVTFDFGSPPNDRRRQLPQRRSGGTFRPPTRPGQGGTAQSNQDGEKVGGIDLNNALDTLEVRSENSLIPINNGPILTFDQIESFKGFNINILQFSPVINPAEAFFPAP